MGREIGERVGSALRTLPERQRAVFVLRHYQELSLEEIAQTLDMSLGTVKSALHRAVARMRERLQGVRRDPPARTLAPAHVAPRRRARSMRRRRAARAPTPPPARPARGTWRRREPRSPSCAEDPVRGAEPPIPLGALVARVQARLDERRPRGRARRPAPRRGRRAGRGRAGGGRRTLA